MPFEATEHHIANELSLNNERTIGPDDPDVPVMRYVGLHGPCCVAYYDGMTKTRIWGPNVPEGRLNDGPELLQDPQARYRRVVAGVSGSIGPFPVEIRCRPRVVTRSGRAAHIRAGGRSFVLRLRGFPPRRVVTLRDDAGVDIARFPSPSVHRAKLRDEAAPEDVVLAVLLIPYLDDLTRAMV